MSINKKFLAGILIFLALAVRMIPFGFPSFSPDEARVAYRGYTLAKEGKDELGRKFPLLFNSLEDYQLPLVSYLTAGGIFLFGKNDFGVRIPFVLTGTAIVFLTLSASKIFFGKNNHYGFFAAGILVFSPALIFFSRFPNEFIIGAFLLLLLFLQLQKEKISRLTVFFIILLMLLTSKILWLVMIPFLVLNVSFNKALPQKEKIFLCLLALILVSASIILYLKVPQSGRSMLENNFSIMGDLTVKNGVEKLRSQGAFLHSSLDRILFNKAYIIIAGSFHWFSQVSLSKLFADFDSSGVYGFLKTGALQKVFIIPFLGGVYYLIKSRSKYIFLFIIFLTAPLVLMYPKQKIEFLVFILPFVAIICASGLKFVNRKLIMFFMLIALTEFSLNIFFVDGSIRNLNKQRPGWLKEIITEISAGSLNYNIAISDDITEDIVPLIEWHANFNPREGYENIQFPYRYRQSKISNIKIIASEDRFYNCGSDKATYIFASGRDLAKIEGNIKTSPLKRYKDLMNKDAIFLMPSTICVN